MIKKRRNKLILIAAILYFFVSVPQVFAAQPPSVTSISPSFGPTAGGTNVTITGTNFDSGTVTIGGALATDVEIVSSTQITATTPSGTAGARDLVFTRTSDGKSGTLTVGFTYVAPHTITASAGAHGSISPSGAVLVNDGDSQSFTITPDADYYIVDVLADSASVGAITNYNFTNVIADHTIVATFAINPSTPDTTAPPAVPRSGGLKREAFFSGQAYPDCKIEVLTKRADIAGFIPEPIEELTIFDDGRFEIILTRLMNTDFLFALRVEDKDGRKTGIISFDVNMREENKLTAEDIFVPPTIGFDNVVVTKGQELRIMGYATPNNKIEIEIDNIITGETQSNGAGYWSFSTATYDLNLGEHYVRTRQIDQSGRESNFSSFQAFKVSLLELPKADFNNDNVVNITDWSIFLYRWGSEDEALKSRIDMDNNGKINIADFSIFLKSIKL